MNTLLKKLLAKIDRDFARACFESNERQRAQAEFQAAFEGFKHQAATGHQRFTLDPLDVVPCLKDKTQTTGFEPHYIYHPAWAARVLQQLKPAEHVDISSSLHFCTLVSAFVPVKFYDYRPAVLNLSNLTSQAADLTRLPFPDDSIASLSCMHVIEHVGLGRYGDPFDYDGDRRAAAELRRVLAPGGTLLMVVPVGRPKIAFNAHRIYSHAMVLELFSGLKLVEFSLITDDAATAGMTYNASPALADAQSFGCGCFWFQKA